MADWSMIGGQQLVSASDITAGQSYGVVTTTGNPAHTKGNYAELLAATPVAAEGIVVQLVHASTPYEGLVDIAIGPEGSEQIVAENLYFPPYIAVCYPLPIRIPAGVRLAARCQTNLNASGVIVIVHLLSQTFLPSAGLARVTTYGANTEDSGGTQVDPGSSANTKGAWSQITAATTAPCKALLMALGGQCNYSRTSSFFLVDIGVGAEGSEQVVVNNVQARQRSTSSELLTPTVFGPIGLEIPTGSRLAVRAAATTTDATDRKFDAILYGID